jgi:short-subunit dehydrogenase
MQASKLFDLGGKVALVTGGSRGIGFQMAEALGEMGCKLAISARKHHELDAASAALRRTNIEVLTIANDLGAATADSDECRHARIRNDEAHHNPIRGLVCIDMRTTRTFARPSQL